MPWQFLPVMEQVVRPDSPDISLNFNVIPGELRQDLDVACLVWHWDGN
jgi:hypothetical protein